MTDAASPRTVSAYAVAVARQANDTLERYGRPARSPAALRRTVESARKSWRHVAIVLAAELEAGLQARTILRRLAARPPADPGLPLALRAEGPRLRPGQETRRLHPRISEGDLQLVRDAAARVGMPVDTYARDAIVVTAAEELGLDVPHYVETGERREAPAPEDEAG